MIRVCLCWSLLSWKCVTWWFYRGSQVCLAPQKRLWTWVFEKHWNCCWELLDHMQSSVLGGHETVRRGLEGATWVWNVLHRSVYVYAVFGPLLRALVSKALGTSGSGAYILKVKHGSWSYLDVSCSQLHPYVFSISCLPWCENFDHVQSIHNLLPKCIAPRK